MIRENKLEGFCRYSFKKVASYLYGKCRFCQAYIRFKKDDGEQYSLFKYENEHNHQKSTTESRMIEKMIEDFPENFSIKAIKLLVQSRYTISNSKFYHTYNKVYNRKV
jgi:hypothetical protein